MAAFDALPTETIQLAEESLRRCAGDAFFQAFYRRLLSVDAATRDKFAKTDFSRQNKVLQHGLGLLFTYAKHGNPALLDRIATRHDQRDLDIAPSYYPHFVESLLHTVREFDPKFDAATEDAWKRSVAPGIGFIVDHYVPPTSGGA